MQTLLIAIAASASLGLIAFIIFQLRRPSTAVEDAAMMAVRNDMNSLRQSTETCISSLTSVFSSQLQGISTNLQSSLATINSEVGNRLDSMNSHIADQLSSNVKLMSESANAVSQRMAVVQNTFAGLQNKVGEMTEQARQLGEMSKAVTGLEQILAAPKLRGNFGEVQLENLLTTVFAREQFEMRYCFPSGDIADAVLFFPAGNVVVDSKFPLENFKKMALSTAEGEKRCLRRDFLRDVRRRIDEIAQKYVRPGDGTFPFALMYIPAENVYYEAIIRDEDGNDLFSYCTQKKVIPVSPNSLYAYLQTIVMGMNGMRISQRAESILQEIESLRLEMGKFSNCYETVGKHIRNAASKFDESYRAFDKIERRLQGVAGCKQEENTLVPLEEKIFLTTKSLPREM